MPQHPSLEHLDHRPWPVPSSRWSWRQSWRDLLFAHWPVPASALQHLVPAPLEVQEFEGTSWVGIVPFRMAGVMRRPFPDLPYFSAFSELNVRLYVEHEGRPGVWFLSLDAANVVAVWAARCFFHLPYFHARMSLEGLPDQVRYRSTRRSDPRGLSFEGSYAPGGDPYLSTPGSLEHWLTERYCLYAQSPQGRLFRAEVHHEPWPLQRAEATIERNEMLVPYGIEVSGSPELLHFSRRIDVVVWSPERVAAS